MDWVSWHYAYDDAGSSLGRRLRMVQDRISEALSDAPPGRIRVVSVCAGQGRDLLGVLPEHPRRDDVVARLVELDTSNVVHARTAAELAGLSGVEVVHGDAGRVEHYADLTPADIVLMCGVFGNISEADVQQTIGACASLCRVGGTVVWTRHRREPDLVPAICDWFAQVGFEQVWLSDRDVGFGVGAHRFLGTQAPAVPEVMFRFVRGGT